MVVRDQQGRYRPKHGEAPDHSAPAAPQDPGRCGIRRRADLRSLGPQWRRLRGSRARACKLSSAAPAAMTRRGSGRLRLESEGLVAGVGFPRPFVHRLAKLPGRWRPGVENTPPSGVCLSWRGEEAATRILLLRSSLEINGAALPTAASIRLEASGAFYHSLGFFARVEAGLPDPTAPPRHARQRVDLALDRPGPILACATCPGGSWFDPFSRRALRGV